jgi:hypothetical protein
LAPFIVRNVHKITEGQNLKCTKKMFLKGAWPELQDFLWRRDKEFFIFYQSY